MLPVIDYEIWKRTYTVNKDFKRIGGDDVMIGTSQDLKAIVDEYDKFKDEVNTISEGYTTYISYEIVAVPYI